MPNIISSLTVLFSSLVRGLRWELFASPHRTLVDLSILGVILLLFAGLTEASRNHLHLWPKHKASYGAALKYASDHRSLQIVSEHQYAGTLEQTKPAKALKV